ncbi:hypothetical protein BCM40_03490 [Planococcus donghaensis]|uniref:Uncharacterized protein n=1 Tax=Planococcus donghaensis TaxID=414778 RepID=A0A1C7EEM7_9BACL|nr:hypothetical protein BCM40_03490 [Planococcus donghaensis]
MNEWFWIARYTFAGVISLLIEELLPAILVVIWEVFLLLHEISLLLREFLKSLHELFYSLPELFALLHGFVITPCIKVNSPYEWLVIKETPRRKSVRRRLQREQHGPEPLD